MGTGPIHGLPSQRLPCGDASFIGITPELFAQNRRLSVEGPAGLIGDLNRPLVILAIIERPGLLDEEIRLNGLPPEDDQPINGLDLRGNELKPFLNVSDFVLRQPALDVSLFMKPRDSPPALLQ